MVKAEDAAVGCQVILYNVPASALFVSPLLPLLYDPGRNYGDTPKIELSVQHAKRMRRIILLSVAFLAPPYFSILLHKRKHLLNVRRVF